MAKYLIVNADDLGISVAVNGAIRRAHSGGIVTSASLLVNMPASAHAVEEVIRPSPGLGVGVHLCLTSGGPVLAPAQVPLLADAVTGRFCRGFVGLWRLVRSKQREEALGQIGEEWAAQVQRAESLRIAIDHLDGHQHVQMIPELFELAVRLARERGLAIRVAGESFSVGSRGLLGWAARVANGGVLKNLVLRRFAKVNRRRWPDVPSTDHYFGALDTGRMTLGPLQRILRVLPEGISEITVHPGLADDQQQLPSFVPGEGPEGKGRRDRGPGPLAGPLRCSRQDLRFLRRRQAVEEMSALVDPALRGILADRRIELVRFGDVPRRTQSPGVAAT